MKALEKHRRRASWPADDNHKEDAGVDEAHLSHPPPLPTPRNVLTCYMLQPCYGKGDESRRQREVYSLRARARIRAHDMSSIRNAAREAGTIFCLAPSALPHHRTAAVPFTCAAGKDAIVSKHQASPCGISFFPLTNTARLTAQCMQHIPKELFQSQLRARCPQPPLQLNHWAHVRVWRRGANAAPALKTPVPPLKNPSPFPG